MNTQLRAIETRYKGYRFRSRLEARWAVFLDTLGVPFEYEKEGFDLGRLGRYLPDFWLPDQQCWVEIKGQRPTEEETEKADALAQGTGFDVYLFCGDVPENPVKQGSDSAYKLFSFGGWDNRHWWCECPVCHAVGIEFEGRSARLDCQCVRSADSSNDREHYYDSPRLLRAYGLARAARFEFGR